MKRLFYIVPPFLNTSGFGVCFQGTRAERQPKPLQNPASRRRVVSFRPRAPRAFFWSLPVAFVGLFGRRQASRTFVSQLRAPGYGEHRGRRAASRRVLRGFFLAISPGATQAAQQPT